MIRALAAAALVLAANVPSAQAAWWDWGRRDEQRSGIRPPEWVAASARTFPYDLAGTVTREAWQAATERWLKAQGKSIESWAESMTAADERRVASGGRSLASLIAKRRETQLAEAKAQAVGFEGGVFTLLDPEGRGFFTRAEAVAMLTGIAGRADLDADGWLNTVEQAVADAALAMGSDLTDERIARRVYSRAARLVGTTAD